MSGLQIVKCRKGSRKERLTVILEKWAKIGLLESPTLEAFGTLFWTIARRAPPLMMSQKISNRRILTLLSGRQIVQMELQQLSRIECYTCPRERGKQWVAGIPVLETFGTSFWLQFDGAGLDHCMVVFCLNLEDCELGLGMTFLPN